MSTSSMPRGGFNSLLASLAVLVALLISSSVALSQEYCSNLNTGSDSSAVSNNYQSNGACSTSCAGYAFAIVQGKNCWCSNYAPGPTTSTTDCSVACPGYPYENCGDESSGLFGYVALGPAASGTQGASSSSSVSSSTSSAVSTSEATQATTTQAVSTQSFLDPAPGSNPPLAPVPPVPVGSTIATISSSSSSSGNPILIPSPSILTSFLTRILTPSIQSPSVQISTPSPSRVTVQDTVTASPSVSVQISLVSITPSMTSTSTTQQQTLIPVSMNLTPSSTSTSSSTSTPTTTTTPSKTSTISTSSWSPTPVTSVITVTGQVQTMTITPTAPPASATTIVRDAKDTNGGFFSNAGKVAGTFIGIGIALLLMLGALAWFCLRRRKQAEPAAMSSIAGEHTPQRRPSRLSEMGLIGTTNKNPNVPTIQTSGWGTANSTEKSPADTLGNDRRSSYPRVVDQRLDPTALWNPLHDNGSHVSVSSFRDDRDYSRRMLRVANPDE